MPRRRRAGRGPPDQLGLLGHSRGGGIAVLHAAGDPRVRALVTWAAISTVERWPSAVQAAWRAAGVLDQENARTGQILPLYADVLDDIDANAAGARHRGGRAADRGALAHRPRERGRGGGAARGRAPRRRGAGRHQPVPAASTGQGTRSAPLIPCRGHHAAELAQVVDATLAFFVGGAAVMPARPGSLADMTGRVCVVTGATRGIGRATAEASRRARRHAGAGVPAPGRRRERGARHSPRAGASATSDDRRRRPLVAALGPRGGRRDPRPLSPAARADQQRRRHPANAGDHGGWAGDAVRRQPSRLFPAHQPAARPARRRRAVAGGERVVRRASGRHASTSPTSRASDATIRCGSTAGPSSRTCSSPTSWPVGSSRRA